MKAHVALAMLIAAGASAAPAADPTPEAIAASNAAMVQRYYPKDALRRGEEGAVQFRISINRLGQLDSCIVTRSSGFKDLDKATCDLMVEHAYFKAQRNRQGWRTATVNDGAIVWKLPDGIRPVAQPTLTDAAYTPEKIVCRREPRMGSVMGEVKICLTEREWRQQYRLARGQVVGMQNPGGAMSAGYD